ncbi:MAG: hypothetical protein ABIR58_05340 [Gemmatimonadaceae bacterium]
MTDFMLPHRSMVGGRTRLMVACGGAFLIALAAGSPSVASAQSAQISGAGISKVGKDTRKLTANARATSGASSATGDVQFIHNSPAGLSRFRGTVSCLSTSGGVVQISGTVDKGETATGTLLDGKAFAFTIQAGASPQSFSLPNFGDAAAIGACSGAGGETVPVTEMGFRTQ